MFLLFMIYSLIFLQTTEYPLTSTKSGRLCKPPKHLINGDNIYKTKNNSFLEVNNDGEFLILFFSTIYYNLL